MELSPLNFRGLVILIVLLATNSHITTCHKFVHCNIPDRWIGTWQSDSDTEASKNVTISSEEMDGKGKCIQSSHDYYIFTKKKDNMRNCSTCLVIFEMHVNVLRYKEYSACEDPEDKDLLDPNDMCDKIEAHSQFHSLYRAKPQLVEACPFKGGTYTFTYRRHNHCDHLNSVGYTCADPSGFYLKYEACHDVVGSESKERVLNCLAVWKEGGNKFLIAIIKGAQEPVLRCFNFKSIHANANTNSSIGYEVAMSGTASCTGLDVATTHGDEYLVLTKAQDETCKFPDWLRGNWQLLNNESMKINFTQGHTFNESIDFVRNHRMHTHRTRFTCSHVINQSEDFIEVSGVYLIGCKRIYSNMTIYQRSRSVLQFEVTYIDEIVKDSPTGTDHDYYAKKGSRIYVQPDLMRRTSGDSTLRGKYAVTNLTIAGPGSSVWMNCGQRHTTGGLFLQANSEKLNFVCSDDNKPLIVLHCHSSWTKYENTYFLASVEQNSQLRCFKITKLQHPCKNLANELLQIESSSHGCSGQDTSGHDGGAPNDIWRFVLNLTEIDPEDEHMIDNLTKDTDSDSDVTIPECHENETHEAPQLSSPSNVSSGKTAYTRIIILLILVAAICIQFY